MTLQNPVGIVQGSTRFERARTARVETYGMRDVPHPQEHFLVDRAQAEERACAMSPKSDTRADGN